MFSFIQGISPISNPLETKETNARPKQKRQDISDEHPEQSENNTSAEDGEYSVLSVKSIILFLADLLEARLGAKRHQNSIESKRDPLAPWLKTRQSNDTSTVQSRQAASAYARTAKKLNMPLKIQSTESRNVEQTEIKRIYSLIRDLRDLQDHDIEYLKINSDTTFVEAIFAAVEKVKATQYL